MGDTTSKKQREASPTDCVLVPRQKPARRPWRRSGGSTGETIFVMSPLSQGATTSNETPSHREGLSRGVVSRPELPAQINLSPVPTPESPPFVPWPPEHDTQPDLNAPKDPLRQSVGQPSTQSPSSHPPAVCETEPRVLQPQPQPQMQGQPQTQAQPQIQPPSPVESNITSPPTSHDNPDPEQSTAASLGEADHVTPALAAFLDTVDLAPLGFLAKDLQKVGVLTVAELKLIARKPEAFREIIPVLADLCKSEQFSWLVFRKMLKKLLEEDQRGGSADGLAPGGDAIGKFVLSLGGGEWIDSGAFADGLRQAGVSSERDLLVLSRDLEKYTERIPFLREFAATNKFGWVIFQVGLEGLSGQKAPTSIRSQDYGTDKEGEAYIKWFLDTIDPDKPLGHLAKDFINVGVTNRIRLLYVADDIEEAVDAMPFFRGLAAGDQLVWAMVYTGLNNLFKSA